MASSVSKEVKTAAIGVLVASSLGALGWGIRNLVQIPTMRGEIATHEAAISYLKAQIVVLNQKAGTPLNTEQLKELYGALTDYGAARAKMFRAAELTGEHPASLWNAAATEVDQAALDVAVKKIEVDAPTDSPADIATALKFTLTSGVKGSWKVEDGTARFVSPSWGVVLKAEDKIPPKDLEQWVADLNALQETSSGAVERQGEAPLE